MKKLLIILYVLIAGVSSAQHLGAGHDLGYSGYQVKKAVLASEATSLLTGLRVWWNMESVAATYGGAGNDLTNNNGVAFSNGEATFIRTSTQFLSLSDNPTVSLGDIDFTWCYAVYPNNTAGGQAIISKNNSGSSGAREYQNYWNPATPRVESYIYSSTTGVQQMNCPALTVNAYNICFFWHDATANKIYYQIGTGAITEAAETVTMFDGTNTFRIGAQFTTPTTAFDGKIKMVALWERVLTVDERAYLNNSGEGREYVAGLIVMNEFHSDTYKLYTQNEKNYNILTFSFK